MFERLTGPARKALLLAHREATLLNHDFLGTEHLLVGVVREGAPAVVRMLAACAVRPEDAIAAVESRLVPGHESVAMDKLPLTGAVKRALGRADVAAESHGLETAGPEHLLLGLLSELDCDAAQILAGLSVNHERCLAALESYRRSEPRETMVKAGVPTITPSREPTIADLESLLTGDALPPSLMRAERPSSLAEDLGRTEQQLRMTQFVLGGATGLFAGLQFFDLQSGGFLGLLFGLVIASFRDSLVGAAAFGLAGFLVGRSLDMSGDWTLPFAGLLAGAFIGSWLGRAWRPRKAPPPGVDREEM